MNAARPLRCDVCSASLLAPDSRRYGQQLVCAGCAADMGPPHAPQRLRCSDCKELFPRVMLLFVEAVGLLCGWCVRWRRLDEFAARVS